jgi:hypothetical protein
MPNIKRILTEEDKKLQIKKNNIKIKLQRNPNLYDKFLESDKEILYLIFNYVTISEGKIIRFD